MQQYNKNRVQLNLIINDIDLYAFMLDVKKDKKLAPFIINLVSAYYYDTRVQEAYENYINGNIENKSSNDTSNTDFIDEAQKNLFAMGAITEALKGTIADSLQDNMMQVKSILSDKEGIVDNVDFGEPLAKLGTNTNNGNIDKTKQCQGVEADRIAKLEEQMNAMMSMLNSLTASSNQARGVSNINTQPFKEEQVELYSNPKNMEQSKPLIEKVGSANVEEPEITDSSEDGKDALDELMNSF